MNYFACVLVLIWAISAFAQGEGAEDKKPSAAKAAFGENFERNAALLADAFSRSRPSPTSLLKSPEVQVELDLTEKQLQQLATITQPKLSELLEVSGFGDGKKFAALSEGDAVEVAKDTFNAIRLSQNQSEEKVNSILTDKQSRRLKQLHLQDQLLFGNRLLVGEAIGLDKKEMDVLRKSLREADLEIQAEIKKLKWVKYLERFRQVVGSAKSSAAFGKPFYIEGVDERDPQGGLNRRREK